MATSPAVTTIEEYLRTAYSPDVDFVDGEIHERNLGEFDHGHLQGLVFAWFKQRMRSTGLVPCNEMRIRISGSRVRICDVGVVSREKPREQQVAVTPPAVCVEILSPEDRLSRAQVVLSDYEAMGVGTIWLIDPVQRVCYTFDSMGLHLNGDNKLRVSGTEVVMDLDELFAELDELNAL